MKIHIYLKRLIFNTIKTILQTLWTWISFFHSFLTELNKALSQEQMCNSAMEEGAGELRSDII